MKNYYAILGLSENASIEDIKKSYRELVRKYHPDMGESSNIERFLEVQEAFEVLRNEKSREAYDRRLKEKKSPPVSSEGTSKDIFSDFDYLLSYFDSVKAGARPRESFRGKKVPFFVDDNIFAEIVLTPEEAGNGGNIILDVPVFTQCPQCSGSGVIFPFTCFNCNGSGRIQTHHPVNVKIPAEIKNNSNYKIDLQSFGIRGTLTIVFKVSYY